MMLSDVKLRRYSSVEEEKVDWLWYPYIPCGKLTILQGDPGEGKSTFAINLIALLTRGDPMPDGYESGGPYHVIYQCAEDDIADTIKPRLVAAGADCDRVSYILEDEQLLTLDDARIEQAIQKSGARFLVLDPLQAFLPQDGDMKNAQMMRAVLRTLSDIADRTKTAVVLIGHMNKTASGKSLYRGLGSIDIAAIARSVLLIDRDPSDPSVRYMMSIKSNLAPEGSAIAFAFDTDQGFQWLGPCEYTSSLSASDESSKRERAAKLLFDLLSDGPLESKEVFRQCEAAGISRRTVQSAKKDLGLKAVRKDGIWFWRIPATSPQTIELGEREDIND